MRPRLGVDGLLPGARGRSSGVMVAQGNAQSSGRGCASPGEKGSSSVLVDNAREVTRRPSCSGYTARGETDSLTVLLLAAQEGWSVRGVQSPAVVSAPARG